MTEPSALLPCPFCDEKRIFLNEPSVNYPYGSINCPACLVTMPGEVRNTNELIACWNNRAAPAQGEPVWRPQTQEALELAKMVLDEWGDVTAGSRSTGAILAKQARIVIAAIPSSPASRGLEPKHIVDPEGLTTSSPAPSGASHNPGEREPSVMPAYGAGEAIFEECAEIALEHVGSSSFIERSGYERGYDQACRDIAEAIRTRASNRKTMDALATKGDANE